MSCRPISRVLAGWLAVGAAATIAGCGPLPPQAPLAIAKTLDSATGDISTACGEAYQITAFPGDHAHQLAALDTLASSAARALVLVDARDPNWIYQGQTIAEIVHNSISYLRACGLPQSAYLLTASGRPRNSAHTDWHEHPHFAAADQL